MLIPPLRAQSWAVQFESASAAADHTLSQSDFLPQCLHFAPFVQAPQTQLKENAVSKVYLVQPLHPRPLKSSHMHTMTMCHRRGESHKGEDGNTGELAFL